MSFLGILIGSWRCSLLLWLVGVIALVFGIIRQLFENPRNECQCHSLFLCPISWESSNQQTGQHLVCLEKQYCWSAGHTDDLSLAKVWWNGDRTKEPKKAITQQSSSWFKMEQVSRLSVTPVNMARLRLRVNLSAFGRARASSYCSYTFFNVARYAIPVACYAIRVSREGGNLRLGGTVL